MDDRHDLEVILRSRTPIVTIESRDEARVIDLLRTITRSGSAGSYMPLFRWTITDGLQRIDIDLDPQTVNAEPRDVLRHIRAVTNPGIYILLDFHPFLDDPVNIRLIKDIAIRYGDVARQLVFLSHAVSLPPELEPLGARFEMALPGEPERRAIIRTVADEWTDQNAGARVKADKKAYELLVQNLAGLTYRDTEQLARAAIFVDGAITRNDLPGVMQAKYELLNRGGVLRYEYETASFGAVGGMRHLKTWLGRRRAAFREEHDASHLDPPKGVVLLGVQGCGKSLAAKAAASVLGVPLLRLDFAAVFDKYHGESERKLRESLQAADIMAPCVLWIDEIEKGLAGRGGETGTTQRLLGSFLTWMAEKRSSVFVVATANDVSTLPPELVRKGRFDEIFFVDLPDSDTRSEIFRIHLDRRNQDVNNFDLASVVAATDGFSGSEIEQAVVAALYAAHAERQSLTTAHLLDEIARTRPLSVVMRERIDALRSWAADRTVSVD